MDDNCDNHSRGVGVVLYGVGFPPSTSPWTPDPRPLYPAEPQRPNPVGTLIMPDLSSIQRQLDEIIQRLSRIEAKLDMGDAVKSRKALAKEVRDKVNAVLAGLEAGRE